MWWYVMVFDESDDTCWFFTAIASKSGETYGKACLSVSQTHVLQKRTNEPTRCTSCDHFEFTKDRATKCRQSISLADWRVKPESPFPATLSMPGSQCRGRRDPSFLESALAVRMRRTCNCHSMLEWGALMRSSKHVQTKYSKLYFINLMLLSCSQILKTP